MDNLYLRMAGAILFAMAAMFAAIAIIHGITILLHVPFKTDLYWASPILGVAGVVMAAALLIIEKLR